MLLISLYSAIANANAGAGAGATLVGSYGIVTWLEDNKIVTQVCNFVGA